MSCPELPEQESSEFEEHAAEEPSSSTDTPSPTVVKATASLPASQLRTRWVTYRRPKAPTVHQQVQSVLERERLRLEKQRLVVEKEKENLR